MASRPQSIVEALRKAAATFPGKPFLKFGDQEASFAEAELNADLAAAALIDAGVHAADRVGIYLPNSLVYPQIWLGILIAGAVAVPINVQYQRSDLTHVIADSGLRVIVALDEHRPTLERIADESGLEFCVASPARLTERAASARLPAAPTGAVLTNLQYTSGTTGLPKACMLTHEYWVTLGSDAAALVELTGDDVLFTAQMFSYLDPLWNVVACLVTGATLAIAPRFSASTFWTTVREHNVTVFYVVGSMPMLLLKQPAQATDLDHKVRAVLCSGIVPALHRELESRWGVPWRDSYGMTETGVDLAVPFDDEDSVGSGAMGRPVPGKSIRVVDSDGLPVKPGEVGELVVQGRALMRGYWNQPEATARVLGTDGMRTGDLVTIDEKGYVHMVGRIKDMVRRGGENVASAEIEGILCTHPRVRNAAIVAVPDETYGEEIRAVVQIAQDVGGPHQLADELFAFVERRLARFKVPRYITFVSDMPLTPSGRIIKRALPELSEPSVQTFDRHSREKAKSACTR